MKPRVLVIAPHPDDETLGVGGTLLRHRSEGFELHWLVATSMEASGDYTPAQRKKRAQLLRSVQKAYRFRSVHHAAYPPAGLDRLPMADVVRKFKQIFDRVKPAIVYVPFKGDAHSDHRVVFEAASACCKWFRAGQLRRVLMYETPSETDAALRSSAREAFHPNVYCDISRFLKAKCSVLALYRDEMGRFPFPRSKKAVESLALWRGSQAGFGAAEAFMLLVERD